MAPSPTRRRFLTGSSSSGSSALPTIPTFTSRKLEQNHIDEVNIVQAAPNQFAPRPKFGRVKTQPRPPVDNNSSEQGSGHGFVDALRASVRLPEDVEDGQLLLAGSEQTSANAYRSPPTEHWGHEFITAPPSVPKRRRSNDESIQQLSPLQRRFGDSHSIDVIVQSRPTFKSASATAMYSSTDIVPSQSVAAITPSRPSFIRPAMPQMPDAGYSPVPEVFSPTRKGQRFVPGGLAASVQQWILQTGQGAMEQRRARTSLPTTFRVSAVEYAESNQGPCFARVVQSSTEQGSNEAALMLVGPGIPRPKCRVDVGNLVVIRPPYWDVCVHGTTWTVCVDWTSDAVDECGP